MQPHESEHSGAVMRKLDEILERQRKTTTRDIVFGLIAALIVVFQLIAFSSAKPGSAIAPAGDHAGQVQLLDEVKRHTAARCGEHDHAIGDLSC